MALDVRNTYETSQEMLAELTKQNEFLMKRENKLQVLEMKEKEFIEYLEDEIELYKNSIKNFSKDYEKCFLLINVLKINETEVQKILKKYKSIIGVSDENN